MMLQGQVTLDDVSGPVGVVDMIGETYEESKEDGVFYIWLNMLNMAILLSANLGVMNLIPIPGLDGGHLLFLIYEMVSGKKPSDKFMIAAQILGMFILLLIMVLAFGNDIGRLL